MLQLIVMPKSEPSRTKNMLISDQNLSDNNSSNIGYSVNQYQDSIFQQQSTKQTMLSGREVNLTNVLLQKLSKIQLSVQPIVQSCQVIIENRKDLTQQLYNDELQSSITVFQMYKKQLQQVQAQTKTIDPRFYQLHQQIKEKLEIAKKEMKKLNYIIRRMQQIKQALEKQGQPQERLKIINFMIKKKKIRRGTEQAQKQDSIKLSEIKKQAEDTNSGEKVLGGLIKKLEENQNRMVIFNVPRRRR